MKIVLKRTDFTDKSIIGELSIDGVFFSYTLENPKIGADSGQDQAIPYGTYKLRHHSPSRFEATLHRMMESDKYKMINVYNDEVPASRAILIHWGNKEEDTAGCILLGYTKNNDFIGDSRNACKTFYARLKNEDLDTVEFEITGPDETK